MVALALRAAYKVPSQYCALSSSAVAAVTVLQDLACCLIKSRFLTVSCGLILSLQFTIIICLVIIVLYICAIE